MHIKSIFVDGFKSYAKRTEITGFDPAFNAITGLNGSGKSNILDAICFLLGITNLSQVRASSLQELVYKSGQAGITKATVSIIFDNKEKTCSPSGYENFDEITITRQIVIGGKNKYLINGLTATNTRVQDLFRSVQLNVNNPHFLIMQGRITKVLNMKPPEILSLLEEAASTKHYEVKRDDALKTIEKKDVKLHEIDKILREDIRPTLAKLKEERQIYSEYQRVVRNLECDNKLLIARDYTQTKAVVDNSEAELNRMKEQHSKEEQTILQCNNERERLCHDITKKCEERDEEHVVKRNQIEDDYGELQKTEVILKNTIKRAETDLKEAQANLKSLENRSLEDVRMQNQMRKEIAKIQDDFDKLRTQVEESKSRYDIAQKRLREVNTGCFVSESGDSSGSLQQILIDANRLVATLKTELGNMKMKMDHCRKEVGELDRKLKSMHKNESAKHQEMKHQQLVSKITKLEKEIQNTGYSNERHTELLADRNANNDSYRRVVDTRRDLIDRVRELQFQYTKPYPNFDEGKIFGTIASLVKLDSMQFALALEVAVGRRLENVVVDSAKTVTQLFNGKCLPNRTTLLPLDKIKGNVIPPSVVQKAQNMFGFDSVWSPMDIIKYDEKFYDAVAYVFGSFLIARDLKTAKQVAFDRAIKCRCVTLDGDIFDPEGSLAGGEAPKSRGIFENARKLSELDAKLLDLNQNSAEIQKKLSMLVEKQNLFQSLEDGLKSHRLELLQIEREMKDNDYFDTQKNLHDTKAEMDEVAKQISNKEALYRDAQQKAQKARENQENAASVIEQAQKSAEVEVQTSKEQLQQSEEAFKDIQSRYETLTFELGENEKEGKSLQMTIESARQTELEKKNELNMKNDDLTTHHELMKATKLELDKQKDLLKKIESEISKMNRQVEECIKNKDKAELKLSDVAYQITCHKTNSADAVAKLKKMLQKHLWIPEEEKHFNKPGTMFDFSRDWREIQLNIEKLEEQKKKLARKVDLRGMNMLGQTEERYNELMTKYNKVLEDKRKLQDVIIELDQRKDEVIKKAHEQVDRDFDKIFSTLLPGSKARLIPPEGKTLSDGLEFKIAFGEVWKDSLNELSGGQRSLVALSLILALLRFKPAPLYILDEVDAALDISHTHNIGALIKEHFSNSQFVIVSLKDGMFNNANVLFKTKFVDGVSTVTRHVNLARRPMTEKNH